MMKKVPFLWIYFGVKTCGIFSLFRLLVLGFGYCLIVSYVFCFLCFTSSMILSGFYTEDEPLFFLFSGRKTVGTIFYFTITDYVFDIFDNLHV